jgi:hypothetical protein
MMKKKFFDVMLVLLSLTFWMFFVGCVTSKYEPALIDGQRFDWTIDETDESTLYIGPDVSNISGGSGGWRSTMVTRFDNQDVQWNTVDVITPKGEGFLPYFGSFLWEIPIYKIKIPSGIHMLTGMNIGQSAALSAKETSTRYNFIAGKEYSVQIENGSFQIKEVTPDEVFNFVDKKNHIGL